MKKVYTILFTLIFCISLSLNLFAQDASGKKEDPMANWWLKNASTLDNDDFLYHFELSMNYTKMQGNMVGEIYGSKDLVVLRKGNIVNTASLDWNKQNLNYKMLNSKIKTETLKFRNYLSYDFAEMFTVGLGFDFEKDDNVYIDDQRIYYIGGGFSYEYKPMHMSFSLIGGYGMEDRIYTKTMFDQLGMTQNEYSSGGILLNNSLVLPLAPWIIFIEEGTYVKYVEDNMGFRYDLVLGLIIPINQYLSFNINYIIKYKDNDIINSINNSIDGNEALKQQMLDSGDPELMGMASQIPSMEHMENLDTINVYGFTFNF